MSALTSSTEVSLAGLRALETEHPLGIPESLGDGAVLAWIPMLGNQRKFLLAADYQFIPDDLLAESHRILPSLQLLRVLRSRRISYRRTRLAIDQVLEVDPGASFDAATFCNLCAVSYTFHEGAHALFYELVRRQQRPLEKDWLVEVLLASEGYAVAFNIASMLQGLTDDPGVRVLLALNISADPFTLPRYEREQPGIVARLVSLMAQQPAALFRFLAAACLVSMLRPQAATAKVALVQRLASAAGLSPDFEAECICLMKMALSVDPGFRSETTTAFFAHLGLGAEHQAVFARPLEVHFQPGAAFNDFIPAAIAVALGTPS